MKILSKFAYASLGLIFVFGSCSKDNDPDPIDTSCNVSTPDTYEFTHDGSSTVYYGGQANRLLTAVDLYNALNADVTTTTADLMSIAETNNLIGKIAENSSDRAHIIDNLTEILNRYAANSAAFESGTTAEEGVAGLDGSYELDENGWEADQQVAKMLIGALCLEQVNYDYLTKMDVDNTDRTYGAPDYNYTKREHYFDEAYGYVYGLDIDDTDAAIIGAEGVGLLLIGKYLNKHTGPGEGSGIDWRGDLFSAFKTGRQAVVEDCQEVLDKQIMVINETLSNVVAWHAADYLLKAADSKDNLESYFHAISEAWGFVYSLQFTKMSDGAPLFNHMEVMDMISNMEENGAYGLSSSDMRAMAASIQNAAGL